MRTQKERSQNSRSGFYWDVPFIGETAPHPFTVGSGSPSPALDRLSQQAELPAAWQGCIIRNEYVYQETTARAIIRTAIPRKFCRICSNLLSGSSANEVLEKGTEFPITQGQPARLSKCRTGEPLLNGYQRLGSCLQYGSNAFGPF